MPFIQDAIKVPSVTILKTLTRTTTPKRIDGMFYGVDDNGSGSPSWYLYLSTATQTESLPTTVNPNDNVGRYIQFTGGGNSLVDLPGRQLCTSGCTLGAKAYHFFTPQPNLKLTIQKGFDINIAAATNIQLHRWSQEPNTGLNGRQWVADIPNTGGTAVVTIDSTYRWISIFAKNPSNSNRFDGVCFNLVGNTITLISF